MRETLKPVSVAIGAAVMVGALVLAANVWPRRGTVSAPQASWTTSPEPNSSAVLRPTQIATQLATASPIVRGWPGPRGGPAGLYSWSGHNGSWMHQATDRGVGVSLSFSAAASDSASALPAHTESRDDWTFEALPMGADGVRKERWSATFDHRRVTVTLDAQPDATAAQLADAHLIIKSIRSDPTEGGAFRLTFTLPAGWDSG